MMEMKSSTIVQASTALVPVRCEESSISDDSLPQMSAQLLYKCSFCVKTFFCSDLAKEHELLHINVRPYKCKYCSKAFGSKGSKTLHERIHTGERPYVCNFCSKSFSDERSKVAHERIHTGERPYNCSYCSKSFATSHGKRTHERFGCSSSKVREYKCAYCSMLFCTINDRKMHAKSCNSRRYKCRYCKKRFSDKSEKLVHQLTHLIENRLSSGSPSFSQRDNDDSATVLSNSSFSINQEQFDGNSSSLVAPSVIPSEIDDSTTVLSSSASKSRRTAFFLDKCSACEKLFMEESTYESSDEDSDDEVLSLCRTCKEASCSQAM